MDELEKNNKHSLNNSEDNSTSNKIDRLKQITCDCGMKVLYTNLSTHRKTKRHKKLMNDQGKTDNIDLLYGEIQKVNNLDLTEDIKKEIISKLIDNKLKAN